MEKLSNWWIDLIFQQAGIIAVTDKDGRYLFVNQKWINDTGIPAEEAVGKCNHELFEGGEALRAIKSRKPIVGKPLTKRIKDGKELPGVISYVPLFEANEVVGCFIASAFLNRGQSNEFVSKIMHMKEENEFLKLEMIKRNGAKYTTEDIVGQSEEIRALKRKIWAAAQSDATVLIEGETGTGKELIAHAIHSASERNIFPFIKVNCSAIPENLMESEFFGYEEGSFTGSKKGGNKGKFERANSGTIFLDEVNLLSSSMQPKLLRVLQEKEVEPIGSSGSVSVDARVIVATNKSLKGEVGEGKFREDLFYRLNVIHIVMPPLRNRRDDIPLLVEVFLEKLNVRAKKKVEGLEAAAMKMLMERQWPGNVRELENVLERAVNAVSAECRILTKADFTDEQLIYRSNPMGEAEKPAPISQYESTWDSKKPKKSLGQRKECLERDSIVKILILCNNNKAETARMLGISRTLLYRKLKKYDISM